MWIVINRVKIVTKEVNAKTAIANVSKDGHVQIATDRVKTAQAMYLNIKVVGNVKLILIVVIMAQIIISQLKQVGNVLMGNAYAFLYRK